MIKLYFKQAWMLMKQNHFYSFVYIIGTGLSISMVMVLAIIFYVRIADTYPENNRSRMLMVKNAQVKTKDQGSYGSSLSLKTIETCFYPLEKVEAVSTVYSIWEDEFFIQSPQNREQVGVKVECVDPDFWKVFTFRFLHGKPFTKEEMESGVKTVVLSETISRKIFGTLESTGQYIHLNFELYRVSGVVRDVPYLSEHSFADVWMPYSAYPGLELWWDSGTSDTEALGNFVCYILASSRADLDQIRKEARENIHRYDASMENIEFNVFGQPDRHWENLCRRYGGWHMEIPKLLMMYGVFLFILLFIPAVSLTGLTDSQMETRIVEMGIRRSFGAPKGMLLKQVIIENLLYTLLGGLAGLLISYIIILSSSRWIFFVGNIFASKPPSDMVMFSVSSLISYRVFFIAFLICLLFNLMAAFIPAWRASRREIVESLNTK